MTKVFEKLINKHNEKKNDISTNNYKEKIANTSLDIKSETREAL